MPLAEQIRELAGRIQTELREALDYYEHTTVAWRLVERLRDQVPSSTMLDIESVTNASGAELADLAQGYISGYLAESVFQQYVTIAEDFIFSLLHAWLSCARAYLWPSKRLQVRDQIREFPRAQ